MIKRKLPFFLFIALGMTIFGLSLADRYSPNFSRPSPPYVTRVGELLQENSAYMHDLFDVVLIGSGGSFMERVNGVSGRCQSLSSFGTVDTARRMIVTGLQDFQNRINEDELLQPDLKPGGLTSEDIQYSVSFSRESAICFAFTSQERIVYVRQAEYRKPLEVVFEEPFSTAVQIIEQENERMNHG
jgi:hypothetical protein